MHLSTKQKYWLFTTTIVLSALYIFEPTANIEFVKKVMEAKIEIFPIIAVKNIVIILLIYMWWKIFEAGR